MKAIILSHVAPIGSPLAITVAFLDNTGITVDAQNLILGVGGINNLNALTPLENAAILAYSNSQNYGLVAGDILKTG